MKTTNSAATTRALDAMCGRVKYAQKIAYAPGRLSPRESQKFDRLLDLVLPHILAPNAFGRDNLALYADHYMTEIEKMLGITAQGRRASALARWAEAQKGLAQ